MFGRRALQVRMVKTQNEESPQSDSPIVMNWADIADVATRFTRDGAIVIGGVYVATRLINAACNIAEIAVKAKLK